MDRNTVVRLVLAFALGVLLTFLLTSGFHNGRYVPFGDTGTRILDTRTGRVYAQGNDVWHISVKRVGKK
jgi:hypothetical protein